MTNLQVVALILLVLAVLAAFLWLRRNVTEPLRRMFPVWAALGPFDSGEKSAAAMRYASMAVYGEKEVKNTGMMEEISKHAAAYDSNPAAWEQTRQQALLSANSETEEFITTAKRLAAMDSLNKD